MKDIFSASPAPEPAKEEASFKANERRPEKTPPIKSIIPEY
jgi:hypothetical protein